MKYTKTHHTESFFIDFYLKISHQEFNKTNLRKRKMKYVITVTTERNMHTQPLPPPTPTHTHTHTHTHESPLCQQSVGMAWETEAVQKLRRCSFFSSLVLFYSVSLCILHVFC